MRCTLVNKLYYMSFFERWMPSSRNSYEKGIKFDRNNVLSLLQITGYYSELLSLGIRLEEIIEWFFRDYLSDEFDAHNFSVKMPSSNSTFLEKCTNIMPAFESVLKQFTLFVEEGELDFQLLEIRSEHLIYKNIPSLIDKKYAYGVGDEFEEVVYLFFSDQCDIGYNVKEEKTYDNFFEHLCEQKCKIDDYPDYYFHEINWLIEHNYLKYDDEGYIVFNDFHLAIILKDLFYNEVISYWNYPSSMRKIIDQLANNNVVEFENSLFSRPEQDYINYFLNKSQFNNGLDLRNKYSHTQPISELDEKQYEQDYMIFLRIFIIAIIKINNEFCILDEETNKE